MAAIPPTILVIIGITGDLSVRKLLPAIEKITSLGAAPGNLKVVGITRQNISSHEVLKKVSGKTDFLDKNLEMYRMNLADESDYSNLQKHLKNLQKNIGQNTQTLFYLSVPPQISHSIITFLGSAGFGENKNTKLLLEKPFGVDLESAIELVAHVEKYFTEDQIYRIDHYLAKEMTQNLVVFRRGNSLIKRTWNRDFIESIEIIASEKIGIEGRAEFYEQTGALRDLLQSHLLQLAALVLADFPTTDWSTVPRQRLEALTHIKTPQNIERDAKRAQYDGYRDEVSNAKTLVETFVSVRLFSDSPRWQDVPITLVSGKSLPEKTTEIRIKYRQDTADEANTLVLHIQPNEGLEFDMWAKKPGYDRVLQKLPLGFSYGAHFTELPEAYERVLLDAMKSDNSLFTRSQEVIETWRILDPIQKYWDMQDSIETYEKGSMPSF